MDAGKHPTVHRIVPQIRDYLRLRSPDLKES